MNDNISELEWNTMDSISIEIPSLTENIRIVESFIDNVQNKYNFNDDIYGNIMIAIIESVSNAIVHGNGSDKSKSVSLSLRLKDNALTFTVEDQGSGFDYKNLDDPTAPDNVEKIGGRGIFLMKHLSDEVAFQKDGKKVELSFYLP